MRTYTPKTGPFREGVFYEDQDIENIATDELRRVNLLPSVPEPIRVERFIEKRLGLTPEYDDLPEGILGYTKFGSRGAMKVVVSRSLSDEGGQVAERRVNSTLAHEAGHILLHGHLFAMQPKMNAPTMFRDEVEFGNQRILCKSDTLTATAGAGRVSGYDGRWWEVQANKMIGALLLPRSLVRSSLSHLLSSPSRLGVRKLDSDKREEAAHILADRFDVNPVVGRRRIVEVFSETDQQLTL